ncbi:RNA polymerase sigma factor [Thermodesulfobacteriota bacterium]
MASQAELRRDSGSTVDGDQKIYKLVYKARAGDRLCLEELIGLFHREIYHMVYYRTGSRMDAEDLTQEIFIKMSKSLRQLKNPALFKAWLFRIAINRVKDFHRKKKLLFFYGTEKEIEQMEPIDNRPDILNQIKQKQFWQSFRNLAGKMSRREREVFILRYMDQLGIKEISETLKKNESTVKTYLYRALNKFKGSPELRALLKENAS